MSGFFHLAYCFPDLSYPSINQYFILMMTTEHFYVFKVPLRTDMKIFHVLIEFTKYIYLFLAWHFKGYHVLIYSYFHTIL